MKFKNKTKGLLAGAVGAALLVAGGTTFALWSDTDSVDGGTIMSGALDVDVSPLTGWMDETSDLHDPMMVGADLNDFRIVPGDTLTNVAYVSVALSGQNNLATLTIQPGSSSGDLLASMDGVNITYDVTNARIPNLPDPNGGQDIATDVPIDQPTNIKVYSSDRDVDWPDDGLGALTNYIPPTGGARDIGVTIKATFDSDTSDQVRAQAAAVLSDIAVNLDQQRP